MPAEMTYRRFTSSSLAGAYLSIHTARRGPTPAIREPLEMSVLLGQIDRSAG
jgi:hypothetical protein